MNLETKITIYKFTPQLFTLTRRVAQLNRVADYGSAGYRFESCRDHKKDYLKR